MEKTTTPYAIRVSGRLGPTTLAAFPELVGEERGSETILAGNVSDGSALYGIIARLEALELELIEVRPLANPGIRRRRRCVRGRKARGTLSHLIGRLRAAAGSTLTARDWIRSPRAHHPPNP
jgi:hypothetical protein